MKLYRVKLVPEERAQLLELLLKGKASARTLAHARILLKADEGVAGPRLSDEAIADALDVNRSRALRPVAGGRGRLRKAGRDAPPALGRGAARGPPD